MGNRRRSGFSAGHVQKNQIIYSRHGIQLLHGPDVCKRIRVRATSEAKSILCMAVPSFSVCAATEGGPQGRDPCDEGSQGHRQQKGIAFCNGGPPILLLPKLSGLLILKREPRNCPARQNRGWHSVAVDPRKAHFVRQR